MSQPGPSVPLTRPVGGRWYFVVTIATVGLLSAVPFWHAWVTLRRPSVRRSAVVYSVLGAALVVLASTIPRDPEGQPIGDGATALNGVLAVTALGVVIAACVQLRPLRRDVFGGPGQSRTASDRVMAGALASRARRDEAREIAGRDPVLARDLGIGRPDLGRGYDDGGLVDVNSAPAEVIERVCMIDRSHALAIVAAREARGGYFTVDEVPVYVHLPAHSAGQVQERGITL